MLSLNLSVIDAFVCHDMLLFVTGVDPTRKLFSLRLRTGPNIDENVYEQDRFRKIKSKITAFSVY